MLAKARSRSSTRRLTLLRRISPIILAHAGGKPGQERDPFVERGDRIDGKAAGCAGIEHVLAQHQMLDIRLRDQDALRPGQPALRANVEKALDLLVDAADGLDFTMLVHRSGHREVLPQRDVRERRQQA